MLDRHWIIHATPNVNEKTGVLQDRLFRLEQSENKTFRDTATQSVWFRNMPKQGFTVSEKGNSLTIDTGACKLILQTRRAARATLPIYENTEKRKFPSSSISTHGEKSQACPNGNTFSETRVKERLTERMSPTKRRSFQKEANGRTNETSKRI